MTMKVRQTQIDDFFENQKGKKDIKEKPKGGNHTSSDIKRILHPEEDEEEEPKVYRQMLHLPDFGTVISLFGIESIEKSMRFVDNQNNPRFQYGIIINRGMNPSERYPKVDVEAWFEKEEVRDERYDKLLQNLEEAGYKIINI